jgi:1,4-alpha-glucan branching enzyme
MQRIHPAGVYEATYPLSDDETRRNYELRTEDRSGNVTTMQDPYRFPPLLTDYDLHLMGEGTHWSSYERLGAQLRTVDGVSGVNFAVWAPNATSVSVIGDLNDWDGRRHPMRRHIPSGIWELFIPHAGPGMNYKFRVKTGHQVNDKSDPYGFAAETPPKTASMVADLKAYQWEDSEWMTRRRDTNWLEQPISVYEVHLGSWRRPHDDSRNWLWYRELAEELVKYCHEMNYTHVELLPVSEHPYSASWGYQTVGYFAVTSRFGSPYDFMYFVDYLHRHGIGVILDWVPAHFPRDGHGLRQFDGTALYEHEDPRQGEHPDWGTLIFNYSRNEIRNFLLSNALFWLDKYHIDGLRVDAVASMLYLDYSREDGQWIPNEHGGRENLSAISLLKSFNELVHGQHPGVLTIAEESTAWDGVTRPTYAGGLGFSLKWNMGWMNDTLSYIQNEPIHRQYHHDSLTFSMIYAFSENFTLPLSHDEVVHGKGSLLDQVPGDLWQKFANLRLLFGYMWTHPGKKLLFMGSDFGQWKEWDHDNELQWELLEHGTHGGLKQLVSDLNAMYRREPALYEVESDGSGFEWIDCHQREDSMLAFLRKAKDSSDQLVVVCNFTPVVRENYRIGVTRGGWYQEILNTDSKYYNGSNVGNYPGLMAEPISAQSRPFSINLTLPPLAVSVFKPAQ